MNLIALSRMIATDRPERLRGAHQAILRKFQRLQGLRQSGQLNEQTLKQLNWAHENHERLITRRRRHQADCD
jgi:hypothetical protein